MRSLVARYRKEHAPNTARETEFFRTMPSVELAIHHAALAIDGDDRCFDHQFRIIRSARRHAQTILSHAVARMRACKTFHELHSLLKGLLSPVRGLGEMYVYDAALRMGAFLSLSPEFVYLHRGTRTGAKALGLDVKREYLEQHELPDALRALPPDDIESFLCIFKNQF
jgi:hypothetical protein